jgi:agmatinase
VAILPVPFEQTVSYGGGTAGGPAAILRASTQVELYDEQLRSEPYRTGVWTDRELAVRGLSAEAATGIIATRFGELLDAGKLVIMLGGEHSITPGGVRAAAKRHAGLTVVQLDAHADLRESYEGDRFSHASAMARCLAHASVRALGIRNYSSEEAERIRAGIPGYRIVSPCT